MPSELRLILKTHLQPTKFVDEEGGTRSHVPLRSKALNSSDMAVCHFGSRRACEAHEGSSVSERLCLVVALS